MANSYILQVPHPHLQQPRQQQEDMIYHRRSTADSRWLCWNINILISADAVIAIIGPGPQVSTWVNTILLSNFYYRVYYELRPLLTCSTCSLTDFLKALFAPLEHKGSCSAAQVPGEVKKLCPLLCCEYDTCLRSFLYLSFHVSIVTVWSGIKSMIASGT